MGSLLCCCGGSEVLASELRAVNPMAPHASWQEECKNDIGNDALGITRDFPRTSAVVGETTERPVCDPHDFVSRNRVVRDTIFDLMALCREPQEKRDAFDRAWSRRIAPLSETTAADISRHLAIVMIEADLLAWTKDRKLLSDADSDKLVLHAADVTCGSNTAKLMSCFHQGFVFYPVQRFHFQMWFPWAHRLQDTEWKARAFMKEKFPEHIYVVHAQKSRNHIDGDDEGHAPQFEVAWEVSFTLDSKTCDLLDAQVSVTSVKIVKSGFCPSKLWTTRRQRLEDRIAASFAATIDIAEVDRL